MSATRPAQVNIDSAGDGVSDFIRHPWCGLQMPLGDANLFVHVETLN